MTDYSELVARLREGARGQGCEAADALEEQGREIELWKEREAQWLRENALVEDENNKLRSRLAEAEQERDSFIAMAMSREDALGARLAEVEIQRDNFREAALQNKGLVEWNRARLAEAEARIRNALDALNDDDEAGAHLILYEWTRKYETEEKP